MAGTVLVVEDEKDMGELLRELLSKKGYDVALTTDALQATMLAVKKPPVLVILDYMLPAGGGAAVYRRLRQSEHSKQTPVIFISSVPKDKISKEVLVGDHTHFLAKPFKHEELFGLLDTLFPPA